MSSESNHLRRLLDELRQPTAYPFDVDEVEVHQTHISVVFLAADRAFKLKKPVDLGFVDYSSLRKRKAFCDREVALNRRLAPRVYRGVVPIVEGEEGLRFAPGADGTDAVEWAVEMERLDESSNLKSHLRRGALEGEWMDDLGRLVAQFHDEAASGAEISAMAEYSVVAGNALDNFRQSSEQVGVTVSTEVFEAFRARTEEVLQACRGLIEERARRDVPRDTHGDLRLEHVYRLGEELVVIDCIEFNDAFRYADPVADVAFLSMDLRFRQADALADRFEDAYFRRAGDDEGRRLLPFYVAYRSAVRGKVHGIRAVESEVPAAQREDAREHSAAHWLFGWSTLAEPMDRPAVVGVYGLPGTGKSKLARAVAKEWGFHVIDSDVVRKELAGLAPDESAAAAPGEGIYTSEFSRRTYRACIDRALERARRGERVIVDATFRRDAWRRELLERAAHAGVRGAMLRCELPRDEARRRIEARSGGPSDAGWEVYRRMQSSWEPESAPVGSRSRAVDTSRSRESLAQARTALVEWGLVQ